jgi:hypothetical protein
VKEIRERGVAEDSARAIYGVHEQADQSNDLPSGIVVRTVLEPNSIIAAVRPANWSVDKNQPLARIRTMEDIIDRQLSPCQEVISAVFIPQQRQRIAGVRPFARLLVRVVDHRRAGETAMRHAGDREHDFRARARLRFLSC